MTLDRTAAETNLPHSILKPQVRCMNVLPQTSPKNNMLHSDKLGREVQCYSANDQNRVQWISVRKGVFLIQISPHIIANSSTSCHTVAADMPADSM